MKKFIIGILVTALAVTTFGCNVKYRDEMETEQPTTPAPEHTIRLMYDDDSYTEYFKFCKEEFESRNSGVQIDLMLRENVKAVDELEGDVINKSASADLFVLDSSDISKAYLSGLAAKNTASDVYFNGYPDCAIRACSTSETFVGYPLDYRTTFLVYNKNLVRIENDFLSVSGIEQFADNTDFASEIFTGVERVFDCNVSDILYSYGFFASGFEIGGKCADDSSKFALNTPATIDASIGFFSLRDYFDISLDTTVEKCYEGFVSGKLIITLLDTQWVEKLEKSDLNYGILPFPNYDAENITRPLSITKALAVNSYSGEMKLSRRFAEFVTHSVVNKMYDLTGKFACAKVKYDNPNLSEVANSYAKSESKNKLKFGEQLYPRLEIGIHNILGGAVVGDEMQQIEDYMKTQIK